MALRIPRVGGLGWVVGLVALLLPLLAWLQVDWVSQVASADGERRARTLETAASQFAGEVDAELGRIAGSLQADGTMVEREDWEAYAQRFDDWFGSAAHPTLVRDVWLVRVPAGGARVPGVPDPELLTALRWARAERTFAAASWSAALARNRDALAEHAAHFGELRDRRERMAALGALGDDELMVLPVLRVAMPAMHVAPGDDPGPPDVRLLGFMAIELDLDVLRDDVLPAIVQRHFPSSGDYRVAVVSAEPPTRTLYESETGAAAVTARAPDLALRFPTRRPPFMFITRRDAGPRGGDRRQGRPDGPSDRQNVEAFQLPAPARAPGRPPTRAPGATR